MESDSLELGSCGLVGGCGESCLKALITCFLFLVLIIPTSQPGLGGSELKKGEGGAWLREQVRSRAAPRDGGLRDNLLVDV